MERKGKTITLPDGFNGHTVTYFAEPVFIGNSIVKLRRADPGKEYMISWKHRSTWEAARGEKPMARKGKKNEASLKQVVEVRPGMTEFAREQAEATQTAGYRLSWGVGEATEGDGVFENEAAARAFISTTIYTDLQFSSEEIDELFRDGHIDSDFTQFDNEWMRWKPLSRGET